MSRTLLRYVLKLYLGFFAGVFAAVLAMFLVTDFVDRAKAYNGPNWALDAALLYGNKALVAMHQLAPAALLLAAGAAVSLLRKRGELVALDALAFGPKVIYLPIALSAVLAGVGLVAFDEWVVVDAGKRVDQIMTSRFDRWGDWRFHYMPKQWFRRGERIFFLRGGDADRGFEEVTLLRLDADFHLAERIDARRMEYRHDSIWELQDANIREFLENGASRFVQRARIEVELQATASDFRIRQGRPEQMKVAELKEQIRTRAKVGLPTQKFVLMLHNRFAYPLAGVPAAILAVALALRPGRKGHLTAALVEGLAITLTMWGVMVTSKTLVTAERLTPGVAAWAPAFILILLTVTLMLKNGGHFVRRSAA